MKNQQTKQEVKIKIEIHDGTGFTLLNENNFESAILDLINEKEWYNFDSKTKLIKDLKKRK